MIVGGGAGGCGTASKFVTRLGPGEVCVIDPASDHYYQPLWTLVGAGVKPLDQSVRSMKDGLPPKVTWLQDSVTKFEPSDNSLVTSAGDVVKYDWLVIATGLQLRFDKIKGLPEAFDTPGVGSNYSYKYVEKTKKAIEQFQVISNHVFICSLFDDYVIKCRVEQQFLHFQIVRLNVRELLRRSCTWRRRCGGTRASRQTSSTGPRSPSSLESRSMQMLSGKLLKEGTST